LPILTVPLRGVTFLIDISYVVDDLVLQPIGWVESPLTDLGTAPCQGDEGAPECWLVFEPGIQPALEGLEPGANIVVITWLHRADRIVRQVHPAATRTGLSPASSPLGHRIARTRSAFTW
jgi:hypothetical protein